MVKNAKVLERFEREQIRKEKLTYARRLAIFDALWEEYRSSDAFKHSDPLEGIETEIRIARILNSQNPIRCQKKNKKHTR